jgi:anti-sigma B factor antagonist
MIDINQEYFDHHTILRLKGEIDASSSIPLDEQIGLCIEKHPSSHLLIDCAELEYISSAGLGVFIAYIKTMEEHNAKLVIYSLNERVKNVFEILGLDQILTIKNTEKEALSVIDAG